MTTTHQHRHSRLRFPLWLLTCLLASVAIFLLWTDRQGTRQLGVLPYLLLLAVPLLHIGLHRAYIRRPSAPLGHENHGRRPGT